MKRRYVVIGAGEVGFHLARLLSEAGHEVVVIEKDAERREAIEEELDVAVVPGNGAHLPVLRRAEVGKATLVLAVTSSDEANMAASLLSKRLGARRTVVRVRVAEDVTSYRREYEESFDVDMLLSTQLLTTVRILNHIRGHNTVGVEYLAGGKVQLRKFVLPSGSPLTRRSLQEIEFPEGCLVVGFLREDEVTIPGGDDRAEPGDEALILALTDVMPGIERLVSGRAELLGSVVIAGGGETGATVAKALLDWGMEVKILERDRERARELARMFPDYQILHGDATELAFLKSERIGRAQTFIATAGQDERNLMASLLAQELGVRQVVALVERGETVRLWKRLGLMDVVSPRALAYERIEEYIESGYSPTIVSLEEGAVVLERKLAPASPAAGVTLAEINPPRGMIVGVVVRGDKVFVPRGEDRLEVGDVVILFVRREELDTVRLLFPGRDRTG
ncbi:MAG: Trk system potassium transporter TrkA [Thermoanaerobaculia bacterium]|nr:Trk system potassium transporter TrkA [Thermoanaerobaculia bacterium]